MTTRFAGSVALYLVTCLFDPRPALAHWCSNIWAGPARLIVKPEKSTVYVSAAPTTLKVYLQNNFPYTLFDARVRGRTSAYKVTVEPAKQNLHPGQNVLFTFTITSPTGGGSVAVSSLDIQVWIRYELGGDEGYRDANDPLVNQNPTQQFLIDARGYLEKDGYPSPGQQSPSLSMATLADKFPTAKLPAAAPFFGRTGVQQLIHLFGYRFCYYAEGGWGCGTQNCPSPCPEGPAWNSVMEFSHNCFRAGVDLAIRKSKLGSELGAARDAALNAMKGGSAEYRCAAAVIGGYLFRGAPSTAPLETALGKLPPLCKAAGLRALGKGTPSDCNAGAYHERAACAGAEGLQKNDVPVKNILIPNSGDGMSSKDSPEGWQKSHYFAYMLYLVTGDNYARNVHPSYYPNVGGLAFPDAGAPGPDLPTPPAGDGAPAGDQVPPVDQSSSGDAGGGSDNGGCGCSAAASRSGSLFTLLLAGLLLLRQRRGARART